MEAAGFAFFMGIGAIGTAFLLGPIGKALAKRLGGREAPPDEDVAARLQELEHRVAELDQANARLAELEERLDFAECMLSRPGAEAQRLDAPQK